MSVDVDFAADAAAAESTDVAASHEPLPLLYHDQWLAVVNKPAGLMVHDSKLARGEDDFLADRLRDQLGKPIFLVHRLDRATSGCLLLAFDRDSASALGKSLMGGDVGKDYLAVCRGWPAEAEFTVDHDLDGGPGKPVKKPAITHFQRLLTGELPIPAGEFPTSRYALLRCQPQTGRFRQIRRHLKHVFHHMIGDTSHGDGRHNRTFRMQGVHRMLLHAERLRFPHPQTGDVIDVSAPLDREFQRACDLFGWQPPRSQR